MTKAPKPLNCIALALAAASLLYALGCSAPEIPSYASATTAQTLPLPEEAVQHVSLPLYFSSSDGRRLMQEMRAVTIHQGESRAVVAVRELISGPSPESGLKRVFWPGAQFVKLEQARGVANVYVNDMFEQMFARDRTLAKAALIKTLHDIDSTQYLNVYSNGREAGYDGKPTGVTEYFTDDLSLHLERVAQAMETKQTDGFPGKSYSLERIDTYRAALYFADPSGRYLLPEVREITVSNTAFPKAIIDELMKGPSPGGGLRETLSGFSLASPPTVTVTDDGDGRNRVTIALNGPSNIATMAIASIVYSVGGFLPMNGYFEITLNGQSVSSLPGIGDIPGNITRDVFSVFAGAEVPLYGTNDSGGLTRFMRTLPQTEANDPNSRLLELLCWKLPAQDESLSPVLPQGDPNDVPRAVISGDTAWVSCSASFVAACEGLSDDAAFLLTYAMVNTMCDFPGVRRVQFLVDGEAADHIAGSVYTRVPLMKNPGLISE